MIFVPTIESGVFNCLTSVVAFRVRFETLTGQETTLLMGQKSTLFMDWLLHVEQCMYVYCIYMQFSFMYKYRP